MNVNDSHLQLCSLKIFDPTNNETGTTSLGTSPTARKACWLQKNSHRPGSLYCERNFGTRAPFNDCMTNIIKEVSENYFRTILIV